MKSEEIDSVAPDFIQCIMGHVRLEQTEEGVYCRQCERTYEPENIVNKRSQMKRRRKRRRTQ